MKCAVHPEVDATGFCRNCGKPMCPACVRPVRDVLYCEDCLAQVMGISPQQPAGVAPGLVPGLPATFPPGIAPATVSTNSEGHAAVAFLLGLVPGLGAVYNGEYNKAIVHVLIFGGIIVGLTGVFGDNLTGFWVLALVGFVFYMAIDALRTAKAKQTGQPLNDPLQAWTMNRSLGPVILIGAGALFLLNNFGFFDYFRVRQIFWPLVLIGIGFLMLKNRVQR
jgi:Domain of unknown function (DUF5668)/B-box zinc finger